MKYSDYIEKNPVLKDHKGADIREQKMVKMSVSKADYIKYLSIYNCSFSKLIEFSIDRLISDIELDKVNPKKLI